MEDIFSTIEDSVPELKQRGAQQVLDDMVEAKLKIPVKHGAFHTLTTIVKDSIPAALAGGIIGAFSGDLDSVKEGAMWGGTLGAGYASGMAGIMKLFLHNTGSAIDYRRKWTRRIIVQNLASSSVTPSKIAGTLAFNFASYMAVSYGIDALVAPDDIFGQYHVDHGLTAKIVPLLAVYQLHRAKSIGMKVMRDFNERLKARPNEDGSINPQYKVLGNNTNSRRYRN